MKSDTYVVRDTLGLKRVRALCRREDKFPQRLSRGGRVPAPFGRSIMRALVVSRGDFLLVVSLTALLLLAA